MSGFACGRQGCREGRRRDFKHVCIVVAWPVTALRQLRERHALSREELARRANISARCIAAIELEDVRPQRATAAVLAAALGCRPEEIR